MVANFIMTGKWQAIAIIVATALLALLVPLLGIISAAALVLVTLRASLKDSLLVLAISTVTCAATCYHSTHGIFVTLSYLLILWLPTWLLGMLLRWSRSLELTIHAALGMALALMIALNLSLTSSEDGLLHSMLQSLTLEMGRLGLMNQQGLMLIEILRRWFAGFIAAGFYLQLLVALLLARNWQAQLYNPGGFTKEFLSLRSYDWLALISTIMLLIATFSNVSAPALVTDLVIELSILVLPLWLLQGLVVIHGIVAHNKLHIAWLGAAYIVLLILTAPAVVFLILLGIVDVAVDFRGWLRSR